MSLTPGESMQRIRYLKWRWFRNFRDSVAYAFTERGLDAQSSAIVEKLRCDGITETSNYPDPALLADMRHDALRVAEKALDADRRASASAQLDRKASRDNLGTEESKEFLQILTPKTFTYDSAYLRYALQPQFIAIANSYLGMHARLRAIHLWLNRPTENGPTSTQLWHRDGDDLLNLKIFTYLTDVGPLNGPFAFVPGSQPLGRRSIAPENSELGRTSDAQMRRVVPESEWRICTGQAGSVIFADTCGYHKGVKPVQGYRVMLMIHYASRAAATGSELRVEGNVPAWLQNSQRLALDLKN